MNENKAGLGYQDFEEVRKEHIFYIDKTDFIREWWENADKVTLITRPRRFGKTLNMSMTQCFFSNQYAGRSDLFEGLSIWEERSPDGDYKYRRLQGTFPVIFLSFANVKASTYEEMLFKISKVITDLYNKNDYLLAGDLLNEREKKYYQEIELGMGSDLAADAIRTMAGFMQRHYGQKVIIILDEYDTPMHDAWISGYWEETVRFFSGLFNSTFKTNEYLERGLITGITRVANVSLREPSESIFTGMNNLNVVITTSDKYMTSFGFTEEEVFTALDDAGLGEQKQKVKRWYDGFTFGTCTDIYNPWSIVSFLNERGKYDTYWSNTSGNGLVNQLIQKGNPDIKQTMEDLLQGKSFEAEIDEKIVFDQLNGSTDAVWSLLLATGYLKVLNVRTLDTDEEGVGEEGDVWYTLTITNLEVRRMFRRMVKGWFKNDTEVQYNEFMKALLNDNVKKMNTFMNKVALNTFSAFDSGNKPSAQAEPERFYHGFVLGMVVNLSDAYKVRSNRESGFGRYDVMIEPFDKSKKAFILEFKVLDPDEDEKTLEDTLANAHAQIEEKQYEAELISSGYAPEQIRKYGFAFRGKECLIG
ncbi:MAG: ATP-binding protein [Lachnospiraceae bacterium]|nr:ATP-binding protein [Lachnospiraceae bacterium]